MHGRSLLVLLTLGFVAQVAREARSDAPPAPVDFQSQVLPVLAARCVKCHGAEAREGGLSLRSAVDLARGGDSGSVVTAGKPAESRLLEYIESGEMPPKGNPRPTADEIELLRRWIHEGAKLPESARTVATLTDQQIIPVLLLRCTPCHGGRRREADLDLRTKAGILRGGKSGPAVVPGKPDESLLVRRIRAEEMPPRRQLVAVSVKPMEPVELQKLVNWIAAGLPESPAPSDAVRSALDEQVRPADREFWSFRRLAPVPLAPHTPNPTDTAATESPLDWFIVAGLRKSGLGFAEEVDRATLYRRVSFDLLGLPPDPDDVAAFVADSDPAAYDKLLDRLLASPRYGERWARHWLDVAGYADSEGSQNEDRVRPNMWRYRDYVIRAFNADKPYDRFLHEQLAGDELADYQRAAEITDELYDNLVATGFLRTAPDRTFANITNFVPDRLEVIADEMQIMGSAVLGLTLHCARCHSHKFDPLTQRDYYRLSAALKDALDEHDWLGPDARQLNYVTSAERQAWEAHEQQLSDQIKPLKEKLSAIADDAEKKKLQQELQTLEARRRPEPKIRALWSRGDPSPTYVLLRGNYLTPGVPVEPGVPAVLADPRASFAASAPWPDAKTTGRRLALARWLTAADHPLTARVFVNRVWKHHFGAGLVTTLANFGKTGAAPSHPELLDWLAFEFTRDGWSVKQLHRAMLLSRTYRQTSRQSPERLKADPENRLVSRMPLRRLEAEALRDALLSVAGQLDLHPFGPPDDVDVRGDGLVTIKHVAAGGRRSVYALHRRTKLPTLLDNFDSPQMGPNCVERNESTVAPQALHLLNNGTIHAWSNHFATRVASESADEPAARVRRAIALAFGRPATADDERLGVEALDQLTRAWLAALPDAERTPAEAARRALRNYCHALMNSAAFVYVD